MDLLKLIKEGREDDFKSKYSSKFSAEQLKRIVQMVTPKFLDWVGRHLDGINFDENFKKIVEALNKFEKYSSNLPITDLYQYKNVGDLISALHEYENKSRRNVRKVEGGNVVYEDDRFFVVNPLDHKSSCYYGKGTKWCTAAEGDSSFNRYNEDGKLFYIIDKKLPTNDPTYKVALLRKFDGDNTFYDAKDDTIRSGWIFNTNEFNNLLSSINEYMKVEYADQLKIYADKEAAKKEQERLEKLRIQRILYERNQEAQERRDNQEWALDENCPEEGLKAHALLNYLVENENVKVLTDEDKLEIEKIKNQVEELQAQYDNDEDVRQDLLDEIEQLEDELNEYDDYIDVYDLILTGLHYELTEFEVINNSDLRGYRYAAGTEDEMHKSCYEYVEGLIDDIGYRGFSDGFLDNYLDEEAVLDRAREIYQDDVYDNPDAYFDDSERQLSHDQEEKIEILRHKIEQTEEFISDLEDQAQGNEDSIEDKVDELNDTIQEMNDEIEEIEGSPEGLFPQELIDEKVDDLIDDVRRDPKWFMDDFGLEVDDYIDRDGFIEGVLDADGYGSCIGSYDGSADEVYVNKQLFYVIRID
jgi:hypothetical protein